jgi:hypothetical protein
MRIGWLPAGHDTRARTKSENAIGRANLCGFAWTPRFFAFFFLSFFFFWSTGGFGVRLVLITRVAPRFSP